MTTVSALVDVAAFLAFRCVHLFTQTTLQRLTGTHDIVAKELSVSGVSLVEEILGFDHVIIIDSYTGKDTEAGRIRKSTPTDFMDTIHPETPHHLGILLESRLRKNPQVHRELHNRHRFKYSLRYRLSPPLRAGEQIVRL